MKLKDCQYGVLVITETLEVGHIVGLEYNVTSEYAGSLSNQQLLDATVPVVQFPGGMRTIHPKNIKLFK